MAQRMAVFTDVQGLFYGCKAKGLGKVDYRKLLKGITEGRDIIRALAYIVQRPDVSQEGFCEALVRTGFELRVKEVQNRLDGNGRPIPAKGDYDVVLAIDAIQIASKVDVIVLVSGDGAYIPLVKHLRSCGCRIEVVAFDGCTSIELLKNSDRFIAIPDDWTFARQDSEEQPVISMASELEDEQQPMSNASITSYGRAVRSPHKLKEVGT